MRNYWYKSKTDGRIEGYVAEQTLAKAKYRLWLNGANDYYHNNFELFLKDIEIRFISKET